MDRSQFTPLTPSSEGPNPYRPYYKPPSVGAPSGPANATSTASKASPESFGSSARNILNDIDYNEFLGDASSKSGVSIKSLVDRLFWKYTSVYMAQPFEVAKTILQVRLASAPSSGRNDTRSISSASANRYTDPKFQDYISDDDDEEPSYFSSAAPQHSTGSLRPSSRARSSPSHSRPVSAATSPRPKTAPLPYYKLELRRNDSLIEVISQLWSREGSWGVWKGTNATFIYSLLLRTIESWTRSMLAALLNLPDPGLASGSSGAVGGLDIIDSPSPLASLGISITAAAFAGLLLAPLDIVRTRLIVTPTVSAARSILPCLKDLGSWTCPPALVAPTAIHAMLPTLFSTTAPLFLRTNLSIDPIITPATYSVCTFFTSTIELFVRLPVETVLRRAQINLVLTQERLKEASQLNATSSRLSSRSRRHADPDEDDQQGRQKIDTVVEVGPYTGIIATMWRIAQEEGETADKVRATEGLYATTKPKRGQGVYGLWRGWRVGWWGLLGVWAAAAMSNSGSRGGEF